MFLFGRTNIQLHLNVFSSCIQELGDKGSCLMICSQMFFRSFLIRKETFSRNGSNLCSGVGLADPRIGAASERRQLKWQYRRNPTRCREREDGSQCFVGITNFAAGPLCHQQLPTAPIGAASVTASERRQLKWQYHRIPTNAAATGFLQQPV